MEIGSEDRFTPRDEQKQQNGIQASALDAKLAEQWEDWEKWEDDINQFFKLEETQETKGNDLKHNDSWIWVVKDQTRWKETKENKPTRR